jgi:hypothetical protein
MSILTDLITLRFINDLRPGKWITILALIYLIFIFRDSFVGEACLAVFALLFLIAYVFAMGKIKERESKANWAKDSPFVKARLQEWEEANKPKRQENPYE